ncbi:MAG: hypothetical protein KKA90_00975 [Nanoarchaeota archaeon]|nr:hypothetical protein [Nanoarchaeota archaeon]
MNSTLLSKTEKQDLLTQLRERFGIPAAAFHNKEFMKASKGRIFLVSEESVPFIDSLNPRAAGFLAARMHKTLKPSTNLLQFVGNTITTNKIALTEAQFQDLNKWAETESTEATDGYVALFYRDICIGCGLKKGTSIKTMVPKGKRIPVTFL